MSLSITSECINCWACAPVCPSTAILVSPEGLFSIGATACTECDGAHADPQCASICPVEGAILDAAGAPINPPGSLTGIPPEKLQAAREEIAAR
ncbi:4Fe-4S binding protein [Varunaivibrio sulfuroxidans]|uniref:4Fe-4S binding protein n=1 Tax=Varunaivibrio sulfuroxidans TaxID=1773489 RepID=A0A4R3J8F4_9PROT|nr:4Fe-4S dicluster domain-containing protein [Varunaivibrio sulfuroxidans]TCS61734.1 4Fe-4S binding protein [Varunaivibrio sulfuroxidans]WES32081.1 4Fe-4S binding protein [Varunaivibrio sulfuroxidans]